MSTQGNANPNSSVNNYSMSSTQNGGGAAPCQNGPGQMYPAMYTASSYYSSAPPAAYPTVAGHSAPPTGKTPVSSTGYSGNYYQSSSGLSPYPAPGTHQYSNAPGQSFQQTAPYAMPAGYYGQVYSHPSQGQTQPQPQQLQPNLMPASSGSNLGAPLYPIVSYPSAPGSSQYGTLRSSQTTAGQPPVSTVMPPPPTQSSLQQYSQGIGATPTPAQPGYGAPPLSQAATVNGQSNAVQQHYDQNLHNPMSHHYAAGPPNSQGPDKERPPSGTPGTSVHSSPQHHPDLAAPPAGVPAKQAPPFGYNYPTMHPAYQQNPAPKPNPSPSHGGYNPPGYQPYSQPFPSLSELSSALGGLGGVSELEAETLRPVNLLQERNILPPKRAPPPEPNLSNDLRKVNCSPDTFRCTLTNIPQTQALLNKARLPLGLLLHPFRDLTQLPVITSNTIVRCRSCRTYINPFVSFLDQRRWKCNLCYRVNDVPDEFMYNPVTRSYGEPHKRPEVQNSTVEFIASSDYMLRPPQPAVYLFLLDVSHNAVESGYLNVFCQSLLDNLEKLPGDTRTHIGFVTFDSTVHFYNLQEGLSQPQMLVVSDIDDVFIPTHDSLLVNLKESKELVKDLLNALPGMFTHTRETQSALGPALQAAYKLMSPTGGRVTVFQTQLPTLGAGLLQSREDPNLRSSTKNVLHLGPATDFYKKLALDCSGQQIGVDLFLLSSQYSDLASLACVSKYSAGSVFYYPSFHHIHNTAQKQKFQKDLQRYLTRKIGFEAVMRIRCTKGLSIHTFHGNFFVRSTDLLSLANVNPDSGFAVQMSIEESLADTSLACFQAALLYTSSKGKRRIRVHTLCLPVVSQLSEVFAGADIQAISCLLANMAIDRSISSSLSDARDALVNAVVDCLTAYRANGSNIQPSGLIAPAALRLFPLYVLALLKQKALRTGTSTRLDERVFSMCELKSQPLQQIMRMVHPDLYRIDNMTEQAALHLNDSVIPQPPLLQLTAEKLTREGAFLLDCGSVMYLWVGKCCNETFIRDVLGFQNYASLPSNMTEIPELQTTYSERTRAFISWLLESRTFLPAFHVVKDDASTKTSFFQHLVEDRTESAFSYYEFLLHIQQQMSK
uniref:SEC24 homolog B, COPII coat complex component n=1 Tax=Cyprinus carpio carpio TaxID=630221 RepID=A0A8C1EGM7_CYPCA